MDSSPNHIGPLQSVQICAYLSKHYPAKLWLIGTADCHLCLTAYELVKTALCLKPPAWLDNCVVDVLDLPDEFVQMLAKHIPILLVPASDASDDASVHQLFYPFGLMDVVALIHRF